MTEVDNRADSMLDLTRWTERLNELHRSYRDANPFPHIVLDDFLIEGAAHRAYRQFPIVGDEGWIHYLHYNERKHGLNKLNLLPTDIQNLIQVLNGPECVAWLEKLTGIQGLLPDPALEGGGLHQSHRGGFLNVHADFTVHPHRRNWRRRVNLLIYFNPGWKEEYQGHLELWSRDMRNCEQRILPIFNRCVIFNTDEDSFHGLPEPIQCPESETRKSLALYYFTQETKPPRKRNTNYRARPQDGPRAVLIWLDKKVVDVYSRLKSRLGLDDRFASRILGIFRRNRK